MTDNILFQLSKYGRLSDMLERIDKLMMIYGYSEEEAADVLINLYRINKENKYNEEDYSD